MLEWKIILAVLSGFKRHPDLACGKPAAEFMLKERKQKPLVPRKSPLSDIHLENMLRLSRMGTIIMAANLGFYNR